MDFYYRADSTDSVFILILNGFYQKTIFIKTDYKVVAFDSPQQFLVARS
jgi:hypothetical protein